MYGLRICFNRFLVRTFHRLPSPDSRQCLPASYGATWPLPRLNFHQQAMLSLSRRERTIVYANIGFFEFKTQIADIQCSYFHDNPGQAPFFMKIRNIFVRYNFFQADLKQNKTNRCPLICLAPQGDYRFIVQNRQKVK